MHPELVVSECSARGDGIAINSGVKILGSRLDMTKRARKTLNYKKVEMSKMMPFTSPTTSRGNFHIFSPELIFLDPLNARDDIETNSGVKKTYLVQVRAFKVKRNKISGQVGRELAGWGNPSSDPRHDLIALDCVLIKGTQSNWRD